MSRLLHSMLGRGRYLAPAGDAGSDTGGTGTGDNSEDVVLEEPAVEDNSLAMSDEDFLKQPMPTEAAVKEEVKAEVPAKEDETDVDPENPDAGDDKEGKEGKAAGKDDAKASGAEGAKDKPKAEDDAGKEGEEGKGKPEAKKDEGEKGTKKDEPAADDKPVDHKAFYEMITKPFKANGREIQIKSPEDAIALMQMGANYNKKMAGIKPHLKLLKTLENNGLLSEEKIGFLIDVSKNDPAAISKLVKESGVDPLGITADKASEYKPGSHVVTDTEVDLDMVLDEIKTTSPQAYTQTLAVATTWDTASKQVIAGSPQLLKVIAAHVDNGIYDRISKEVENERLFGRLAGLSDIEAYRQVGDAMHRAGKFGEAGSGSSQSGSGTAPAEKVVVAPPKKDDDKGLKDKRRAASPSRPSAGSPAAEEFNPLSMSDEEFEKLAVKKF